MYIEDNRKVKFNETHIGAHFEYNNKFYVKYTGDAAVCLSDNSKRDFSDELILMIEDEMSFEDAGAAVFQDIPVGEFFDADDLFLKVGDEAMLIDTGELINFSPEDTVNRIETEMIVEGM